MRKLVVDGEYVRRREPCLIYASRTEVFYGGWRVRGRRVGVCNRHNIGECFANVESPSFLDITRTPQPQSPLKSEKSRD